MKKKTTVFIQDGQIRSYEDPLRRLAPIEKIKSTATKDTDNDKEPPKPKSVYHRRLMFRLHKFALSFALSILCLYLCLKYSYNLTQYLGYSILCLPCSIASSYYFSRLFFLEIGKSTKKSRCLKASRIILYVIMCGRSILVFIDEIATIYYYDGCESLIKGNYFQIIDILEENMSENSVDAVSLVTLFALIMWIIAIVIAIFNKIMVNVHNQE